MRIRTRRPVDPEYFIPIDFDIARRKLYRDSSTGKMTRYRHIRAITPRNIAKSYGTVGDAVERSLKAWVRAAKAGERDQREKFIYLRRSVEELQNVFPSIMDDVGSEFPAWEFSTSKNILKARPYGSKNAREWKVLGYGMALTQAYSNRSKPFPGVVTILFDEFIDDGSLPIKDEEKMFQWLYDSVNRGKKPEEENVETILMANPQLLTPGVSNGYFTADGITVTENMPEFISVKKKSTLYWFPPGGQFGHQKVTDRQRELEGTEYAEMSYGGKHVNAMGTMTGKRGRYADLVCALRADKKLYSVWRDGDYLYAERSAPKEWEVGLALKPRDVGPGFRLPMQSDYTLKILKAHWRAGAVYFQDTQLRDELEPFMLK